MENNDWDLEATEDNNDVSSSDRTISPQNVVLSAPYPKGSAESVLSGKDVGNTIAFSGPLHFHQALQSLQKYPRSFVKAWLLLAKSLGLSVQSVQRDYQIDATLSINEISALAMLKDLPHDQILAWYGDGVMAGLLPVFIFPN